MIAAADTPLSMPDTLTLMMPAFAFAAIDFRHLFRAFRFSPLLIISLLLLRWCWYAFCWCRQRRWFDAYCWYWYYFRQLRCHTLLMMFTIIWCWYADDADIIAAFASFQMPIIWWLLIFFFFADFCHLIVVIDADAIFSLRWLIISPPPQLSDAADAIITPLCCHWCFSPCYWLSFAMPAADFRSLLIIAIFFAFSFAMFSMPIYAVDLRCWFRCYFDAISFATPRHYYFAFLSPLFFFAYCHWCWCHWFSFVDGYYDDDDDDIYYFDAIDAAETFSIIIFIIFYFSFEREISMLRRHAEDDYWLILYWWCHIDDIHLMLIFFLIEFSMLIRCCYAAFFLMPWWCHAISHCWCRWCHFRFHAIFFAFMMMITAFFLRCFRWCHYAMIAGFRFFFSLMPYARPLLDDDIVLMIIDYFRWCHCLFHWWLLSDIDDIADDIPLILPLFSISLSARVTADAMICWWCTLLLFIDIIIASFSSRYSFLFDIFDDDDYFRYWWYHADDYWLLLMIFAADFRWLRHWLLLMPAFAMPNNMPINWIMLNISPAFVACSAPPDYAFAAVFSPVIILMIFSFPDISIFDAYFR